MQSLPRKPGNVIFNFRFEAVQTALAVFDIKLITDKIAADTRQMHPDLMRPPGFQIALYQRRCQTAGFQGFIIRCRRFAAAFRQCHFFTVKTAAPDISFNAAVQRVRNPVNNGMICPLNRMFGKLLGQSPVRPVILAATSSPLVSLSIR